MKKIFAVVLFSFVTNSFAQLLEFGPQISMNATNLTTQGFKDDKANTTLGYGAFVRVNVLILYGQAEIGYAKSQFNVTNTTGNTQYDLSGPDLTALVGVKVIPLGEMGNIRLFAGYNWQNYSSIKESNPNANIDFNKNNSSAIGGVGVDLWKLTLDFRYLYGLTDIDDTNSEIKTGITNISLGFKF